MDDKLLCSSSWLEYKGQVVGISPIDEVEQHWVSREDEDGRSEEREHMFDKVVTPSDVGKLNRLVIPKQHAEKYLPSLLADKDSSSNSNNHHKGLLLNFEDRNGKPWRFRYSYWNSSQSYVMTKGWSRFVKDKKLDAGDIISFHRSRSLSNQHNKLFIDWHRRPRHRRPDPLPLITTPSFSLFPRTWTPPFLFRSPPPPPPLNLMDTQSHRTGTCHSPCGCVANPYSSASSLVFLTSSTTHPLIPLVSSSSSVELHGDQGGAAPMLFQGKAAAAKRLRLFGVNMDCPISHQSTARADDCDILSSTSSSSPFHFHHHQQQQNCAAAFGMSTHIGPPYPSSSSSSSANPHHLPLQLSRLHNTTFLPANFHDKGSLLFIVCFQLWCICKCGLSLGICLVKLPEKKGEKESNRLSVLVMTASSLGMSAGAAQILHNFKKKEILGVVRARDPISNSGGDKRAKVAPEYPRPVRWEKVDGPSLLTSPHNNLPP